MLWRMLPLSDHRPVLNISPLRIKPGQDLPFFAHACKMHNEWAATTILLRLYTFPRCDVRVEIRLWAVFDVISYILILEKAHEGALLPPDVAHGFLGDCPRFCYQRPAPGGQVDLCRKKTPLLMPL